MEQLELPLWEELRAAQVVLERANLGQLLEHMDQAIDGLSESEQLGLAGEVLLQVADLYATRSQVLMTDWEEADRDPIVEQGFFSEMVRQTMAVDLSDLMEPARPRQPRTKKSVKLERTSGSIVQMVDKAELLALVERVEQAEQMAVVAHEEFISEWSEIINIWLREQGKGDVPWAELQQGVGLSWVELWLGLLLGGFQVEQRGEFYSWALWVKVPQGERW